MPALHRELVDEDDIQNQPADGEQTIARAVDRAGGSIGNWHVIESDRDRKTGAQHHQRRDMNTKVKPGNQRQKQDGRNCRNKCREVDIAERIVELRPG